jgi:hypothetical protein
VKGDDFMKKIILAILALVGIGLGSLQWLKADTKSSVAGCCPLHGTEVCQPPETCCCK